jgi:hypothetical protein
MEERKRKKLDFFNKNFKIVDTPLTDLPKDLSPLVEKLMSQGWERTNQLTGDCQTYGKTAKNIVGASFPRAIMFRCFSTTSNPRWLPRHAVLWVHRIGWIDSSNRKFRNSPLPNCIPIWPVTFPAVAFVVHSVVYYYGWLPSWWPI